MEMPGLGMTWGEFGIILGALALCLIAFCALYITFSDGEIDL